MAKKKNKPQKIEHPTITINVNRELSALSRRLGTVFGGLLSVTDETLRDHSKEGYKLYNDMMRKDSQLGFCFRKRADLVLSLDYNIEAPDDATPAEQDTADWFQDMFEDIDNFNESRRGFFKGIAYGFRPVEIMFKKRDSDGLIGIDRFACRDPERFRFTAEGELLLYELSSAIQGEKMPWYKFVINTWGSDETPYGEGLLRELFPLWFFKNESIKSLMRFTEKFGTPYLFATYPVALPPAQQTALLETLVKLHNNSVGIGPEGSTINVSDPGRSGVQQLFEFILDKYVDRQYAKAVLGQTLSTESESGTFALAKFQSKGQQSLVESDSKWHEGQLNKLIKNLHNINFGAVPAGRYPRFRIAYEESKDVASMAEGIGVVVNNLGLPVGEQYARDQLGIPEPAEDEETLAGRKVAPAAFRGFGGSAESDGIDNPDANNLDPVTMAWVKGAVKKLNAERARHGEQRI